MDIAAIIIAVLALCVSVWLARLARVNALEAARRQVQVEKAYAFMEQSRGEIVAGLDGLFDSLVKLSVLNAALGPDDPWLPGFDARARDRKRRQGMTGATAGAYGGIWEYAGWTSLGGRVRAFPPFTAELLKAVLRTRTELLAYAAKIGSAFHAVADEDEDREEPMALFVPPLWFGAHSEFLMSVKYVVETYYQNAILGEPKESIDEPPYVINEEGSWLPAWDLLPMMDELRGLSEDELKAVYPRQSPPE